MKTMIAPIIIFRVGFSSTKTQTSIGAKTISNNRMRLTKLVSMYFGANIKKRNDKGNTNIPIKIKGQ